VNPIEAVTDAPPKEAHNATTSTEATAWLNNLDAPRPSQQTLDSSRN